MSRSFASRLAWILAIALLLVAVVDPGLMAQTTDPPVEPAVGSEVTPVEKIMSFDERVNAFMAPVTEFVFKFVFVSVEISFNGETIDVPLILLWLVGAALVFTISFRFINLRSFGVALKTIKGRYSSKDDPGEISHFQALTAALSATVGLGNIAGVAIAVSVGGPGAVFWMVVVGFLGMTSKFAECTLGVKYRQIIGGKVFGGPMYYLRDGFKERDMEGLGKVLGVLFAVMCVGAALGGGNMFQANQSGQQLLGVVESEEHLGAQKELSAAQAELAFLTDVKEKTAVVNTKAKELAAIEKGSKAFDWMNEKTGEILGSVQERLGDESAHLDNGAEGIVAAEAKVALKQERVEETKGFFSNNRWLFGVVMAVLVGLVIIGGITGIATVTARLVPVMTVTYALACIVVLLSNAAEVPAAFGSIVREAFVPTAVAGGFIGAFIQGIRRAAFSNEAGFGSAPIAHAAVKTKYPASEGLVALLEPFVDTIIVCTMTGLAIVVTSPIHQYNAGDGGIQLTSAAFESVVPWFKYILLICVVLFAFSTMISWSYYGQQAWSYLFGRSKTAEKIYKVIFCVFIVIGASLSLGSVLDFSDGMLFAMSLFNLIGVYVLLPVVRRELSSYMDHVKATDRK